ncbi:hypothetical protein ACVGWC_00815, partial [Enterobacter hormaechei]
GCAFRRVAATPYPAYGMCVLPGGGYPIPGLPDVRFARWGQRLNRPTGSGFLPVAATQKTAKRKFVFPGGGTPINHSLKKKKQTKKTQKQKRKKY